MKGTGLAWLGVIIQYIGGWISNSFDYWIVLLFVGMSITTVGSVLWAQRKNRHALFGLFGILAPIGFIVIALLRDKSVKDKVLDTCQPKQGDKPPQEKT
jgi:hypothetical protein